MVSRSQVLTLALAEDMYYIVMETVTELTRCPKDLGCCWPWFSQSGSEKNKPTDKGLRGDVRGALREVESRHEWEGSISIRAGAVSVQLKAWAALLRPDPRGL